MRCLYCGESLSLLRRLSGKSSFCSDAHQDAYQKRFDELAVGRLRGKPDEVAESPAAQGETAAEAERELARPDAAGEVRQPELRPQPAAAQAKNAEPKRMGAYLPPGPLQSEPPPEAETLLLEPAWTSPAAKLIAPESRPVALDPPAAALMPRNLARLRTPSPVSLANLAQAVTPGTPPAPVDPQLRAPSPRGINRRFPRPLMSLRPAHDARQLAGVEHFAARDIFSLMKPAAEWIRAQPLFVLPRLGLKLEGCHPLFAGRLHPLERPDPAHPDPVLRDLTARALAPHPFDFELEFAPYSLSIAPAGPRRSRLACEAPEFEEAAVRVPFPQLALPARTPAWCERITVDPQPDLSRVTRLQAAANDPLLAELAQPAKQTRPEPRPLGAPRFSVRRRGTVPQPAMPPGVTAAPVMAPPAGFAPAAPAPPPGYFMVPAGTAPVPLSAIPANYQPVAPEQAAQLPMHAAPVGGGSAGIHAAPVLAPTAPAVPMAAVPLGAIPVTAPALTAPPLAASALTAPPVPGAPLGAPMAAAAYPVLAPPDWDAIRARKAEPAVDDRELAARIAPPAKYLWKAPGNQETRTTLTAAPPNPGLVQWERLSSLPLRRRLAFGPASRTRTRMEEPKAPPPKREPEPIRPAAAAPPDPPPPPAPRKLSVFGKLFGNRG